MLDTSKLIEAVGGDADVPDENVIDRLRFDDSLSVPIELTDLDLWSNYINEDLYHMDVKMREFFKSTQYARKKKGYYKTTASVMFSWIYGRKPGPADSSVCRMIHKLLKYYCTSYTGPTTFQGKKVPCVYEFSKYAVSNKRPYSLRLRLEESEDGKNVWRRSCVDDSKKRRNGRRKHSQDGIDDHGRSGDHLRGEPCDDRDDG